MPNGLENDSRLQAALQTVLDRGETAVSVAAYYKGSLIVRAHAGHVDPKTQMLVNEDTIFPSSL